MTSFGQVRDVLDEIGFTDDGSNDGSNTRLYVAITGRGFSLH